MDRELNLSEYPAPLVPSWVDLREFKFMPLEVARLLDSEIMALEDAEAFRAGVVSWCKGWHQVPAASLPNDDGALCKMLGYGRDLKTWVKLRKAGALRGWVLCSDGRLYHPVVAEKAMKAWAGKVEQRLRTAAARIAKMVKSLEKATDPAVRSQLQAQIRAAREEYERDALAAGLQRLSKESDRGPPDTAAEPVARNVTGAAAEPAATVVAAAVTEVATGSKREGEGEGDLPPTPKGKAAKPWTPEAEAVVEHFLKRKDERWPEDKDNRAILMTQRTLAQQHLNNGATVDLLTEVIDRGIEGWKKSVPPRSLLAFKDSLTEQTANLRRIAEGGGGLPAAANDSPARPFDPHEQARVRLRSWVQGGRWESHWGEQPGHPMCQIPKAVVLEEIPGFKPGWKPPVAGSDKGAA